MTLKDVFLSHAAEDKDAFVRPFAQELSRRGITFWLDEAEIRWGDPITSLINEGLRRSRYVMLFLSTSYLGKRWPEAELGAALSVENAAGHTVVLPMMLADPDVVLSRYPLLRDKAYLTWTAGITTAVDHLARLPGLNVAAPQAAEALFDGPTLLDVLSALPKRRFAVEQRWLETMLLEQVTRERPGIARESIEARGAVGEMLRALADKPITAVLGETPAEFRTNIADLLAQHELLIDQIKEAVANELPSDGLLEIANLTCTRDHELDVTVRNLSNDTIVITRLVLRVLNDRGVRAPILDPSATYTMPVGSLNVGDSRHLDVWHAVTPHGADRLRVALDSARVLRLRLTLEYNKRYSVSANLWV